MIQIASILFIISGLESQNDPAPFEKWLYSCSAYSEADPDVLVRMKSITQATVIAARKNLGRLDNHDLLDRIDRSTKRELKIDCGFFSDVINPLYHVHKNTIYLGASGISMTKFGKHRLEARNILWGLSSFFHEFLHFAGVENFSAARHNHAKDKEDDLVYACTSAALAMDLILKTNDQNAPTDGDGATHFYFFTRRACMTCAQMTDNGYSVSIVESERSQKVCEGVFDDDFRINRGDGFLRLNQISKNHLSLFEGLRPIIDEYYPKASAEIFREAPIALK